jgi:hypothetical protein
MIVNGTSTDVRMMIVSNTPSCGLTYNCNFDDYRGVIYAPRVINYAPRVINYAPMLLENIYSTSISHNDCHMTIKNIFIVHATVHN